MKTEIIEDNKQTNSDGVYPALWRSSTGSIFFQSDLRTRCVCIAKGNGIFDLGEFVKDEATLQKTWERITTPITICFIP